MYSAGLGNPGVLDWLYGLWGTTTEWPTAQWQKFRDAWDEFRATPSQLQHLWSQYQMLYEEAERRGDRAGMREAQAGSGRVDSLLRSHSSVMGKIAQYLPTWRSLDAGEPIAKSGGLGAISLILGAAAIAALAWVIPKMFQILSNAALEYKLFRSVEQKILTTEQAKSLLPPHTELALPIGGGISIGIGTLAVGGLVLFAMMRK